jgi:hypothetical protein
MAGVRDRLAWARLCVVTDSGGNSPGAEPGYELNFDLDGSSFAVRENLVDVLERELLGPKFGPDEVLPLSPRAQYLVGHIAPVKLLGNSRKEAEEDVDADGELIEVRADVDSADGRGVPTYAADDSEADDAGDDVEDRGPRQGLMIPASMGLRFQVPADLPSFTVTASWGSYTTVQTDEETKAGRKRSHFQREPVEIDRQISLTDLGPGRTATVALQDAIVLRVDRYDDANHGRVLVEIALCNDRETPMPIPVNQWLFQTKLRIDAGGQEVFLPVRDVVEHEWPEHDDEVRRLDLQYRDRLEFAIGRTCSVDWVVKRGSRRATQVSTTWLPTAETPQTQAGSVSGAELSMEALASASPDQLRDGLEPLVHGYASWINERITEAADLPPHLAAAADLPLFEAGQVRDRLAAGLQHLTSDAEALRCFQFMNRVMRDQRLASQVAAARASDATVTIEAAQAEVAGLGPQAASWRPFQLAFILMQLGALTDPTSPVRSEEHLARVELLFFPTGGGKTEAYLGLAAYTFAIRRRQAIVETASGPLDGRDGVAVLMRYTLRLLTAQQFQRATALVCAAELTRLDDEATWGVEPFRIGLWVGTDVSPKRFEEADEQLTRANEHGGRRLPVLQIKRCPWCGTPIGPAQVRSDKTLRRVFVHCGDELARCPFAKGGAVAEGLPVLTVDEEIYRLTPAFVIATVDKFARLAREGEAASLFGYVSRRCERHGYVHPDYRPCDVGAQHPKSGNHPAASVNAVGRLRPPDLIIQDELHLITGALGTAVGLFEVAVETLSSWIDADGKPVRPMIVASTATVRNAGNQVRGLYGRGVAMFPPQVLDVADTYFSKEVPISAERPGRRYIGISAQGVRLSTAEIRAAEVLLLAGQLLLDRAGAAADPYLTLVGYFNATRELAGMARYVADDVTARVGNPRRESGFPRRRGTGYGGLNTTELTSRVNSDQIGTTLDRLALEFDPEVDSTEAIQARIAALKAGEKPPRRKGDPFDVVLATSMLQVGVDVQRLGLMLVVGQPKNTAEYIQASSRVGRDDSRPGLVVSLGNWARPRDLAHFEQFRHYHETFYAQVEALSVTPYSRTSLERGIDGLLVSAARVEQATVAGGLSPERQAGCIEDQRVLVESLVARLQSRIDAAAQDEASSTQATQLLENRLARWTKRAARAAEQHKTLVYERTGDGDEYLALITSPENAREDGAQAAPFEVANSMREVQPEINILVSPVDERLYAYNGGPAWTLPVGDDDE